MLFSRLVFQPLRCAGNISLPSTFRQSIDHIFTQQRVHTTSVALTTYFLTE